MSALSRQRTVTCPACARSLKIKPGIFSSEYRTREGTEHIITTVIAQVEDHYCPTLVRRRPKDKDDDYTTA